MRTCIVADWLPVFGGAEHVVAEFHGLWPDAPIYTTIARKSSLGPLADADVRPSPLQTWYRLTGRHQWLLPWMPRAMENMDLDTFDLIISSSHAIGKGIVPGGRARHVCYCHTPMRYAWEMEEEYLKDFRVPKALRKILKERLKAIRRWDLTTAKRVDMFIANSKTTQERIKRIYNRESIVIHPPVQDRFFDAPMRGGANRSYYLALGRLVPYKRFDILIAAANALKIPLKIAGTGQDLARLKTLAGPTVEMLGFVDDTELPALYGGAKALLFAPLEDAGVVPLEAQASGTPIIAFGQGGVLDTVAEGVTGLFFREQKQEAVADALLRFKDMRFDPDTIREHARQFSAQRFREKIREAVAR